MAQEKQEKVYEYDRKKVRETLVRGFRSEKAESTIADLAGLTGLPLHQIEAELPAVADEFGARLKVTETGEILYSFPRGMKSRFTGFGPTARKVIASIKDIAVKAAKVIFKAWIMVMLVGYFVLFLALALFAMVASVAIQQGGNGRSDNRRGGGLGGLWLTGRLFDSLIRIWFYSELFKSPQDRGIRGFSRGPRRPLHKAIFSHVFGDGDPNRDWPAIERKAVVAFLQTHKGVMTMAEFMAITGQSPQEAELSVNRYLLEFEGSPEVTDRGTLHFVFPKLLARVGTTPEIQATTVPLKRTEAFSSNEPKADRTFRLINVFNLVFGGYFLSNAITVAGAIYVSTPKGLAIRGGFPFLYSSTGYLFQLLGSDNPVPAIFWGLGVVPIAFSVLFFAIPLIRSIRLGEKNESVKKENLRRIVYRTILGKNGVFTSSDVSASIAEARPRDTRAAQGIAGELAAWSMADPTPGGYDYKRIREEQDDIAGVRSALDVSGYRPGSTVFDTEAP